jgi:DNA-binding Lrp family transcriptional regulator
VRHIAPTETLPERKSSCNPGYSMRMHLEKHLGSRDAHVHTPSGVARLTETGYHHHRGCNFPHNYNQKMSQSKLNISTIDTTSHNTQSGSRRFKLTDTQRIVLAQVDLDARASIENVATACGLRQSTVRHTLERLKTMLDLRPCCWTDPYKMGETPYRILFSVHAGSPQRLRALLKYLVEIPQIHWVGTLIGYYQVGLHLRASSFDRLRSILDMIDRQFGEMIVQKEYSIISELTFLPYSPVREKGLKKPKISFCASTDEVSLDELDRTLIHQLQTNPLAPISQLGRTLGIAATTLAYRFNNLVRSGVILGFFYSHDERGYGLESYLILVSVVGLGGRLTEALRNLATKDPRFLMFTSCTGRWDFEFEVVVSDVRELQAIVDDIHSVAAGSVRDVLIHAWGDDLKG